MTTTNTALANLATAATAYIAADDAYLAARGAWEPLFALQLHDAVYYAAYDAMTAANRRRRAAEEALRAAYAAR